MLEGKTAIVTGASRGIGREIAKALAREGAFVVVNYHGSADKAEETVQEIRKNGGKAEAYPCDVSDFHASEEMVKHILKEYGKVDILINNAGITRDGLLMRMSEEDFDRVLAINLKGSFHMIRHLSRQFLKQRSGRIISISSISGILGNAGQTNYAASKAGIIGLTKSAARELAGRGVCVNAIAPGFIETEMTNVLSESVREAAVKQIPLGHFGKPEDVAELAVFLASDRAKYITGQVICVDGGAT